MIDALFQFCVPVPLFRFFKLPAEFRKSQIVLDYRLS
jgi:hypothetical protein